MKHIIFETKEQYLSMKHNWATYFNTEARNLDRSMYGNKIRKLTATHFILYAILRGKNPYDCIQSCDGRTLNNIKSHISFAQNKRFGDNTRKPYEKFFDINSEQCKTLFDIAYDIFHNGKSMKSIKMENIEPLPEELFTL